MSQLSNVEKKECLKYESIQSKKTEFESEIRSKTKLLLSESEIVSLVRFFCLAESNVKKVEFFGQPTLQYGFETKIKCPQILNVSSASSSSLSTTKNCASILLCPSNELMRFIRVQIPDKGYLMVSDVLKKVYNRNRFRYGKLVSLFTTDLDYCIYLDNNVKIEWNQFSQKKIFFRNKKRPFNDSKNSICGTCKVFLPADQKCNNCYKPQLVSSSKKAKIDGDDRMEITLSDDEEKNQSQVKNHGETTASKTQSTDKASLSSLSSSTLASSTGITVTVSPVSSAPKLEMDYHMVQVGSYKRSFSSNILLDPKEIRFCVPRCSQQTKSRSDVAIITLQFFDIIKMTLNLDPQQPVIIVLTTSKFCTCVRSQLQMVENGYNYCSAAKKETFKRLVFFLRPESITDHLVQMLRKYIPRHKVEHLSKDALNALLNQIRINDKLCTATDNKQTVLLTKKSSAKPVDKLLVYKTLNSSLTINVSDYTCLATDQFLNDVILEFYIDYILRKYLSVEQQQKVYVFSTFFYPRLINKASDRLYASKIADLSDEEKRHFRVKNWTRSIKLFEKDFIFIPINDAAHWYLAVICFPNQTGCRTMDTDKPYDLNAEKEKISNSKAQSKLDNTLKNSTFSYLDSLEIDRDEAEAGNDTDVDEETATSASEPVEKPKELPPLKQPCILIFDSLSVPGTKNRVISTIRGYLRCEYRARYKCQDREFSKDTMPGYSIKVPQQTNYTDCGLYVLQYIENFLAKPIKDFRKPIKGLENWFDELEVTSKRELIANLITEKVREYDPNLVAEIPDISFPTRNGQLVSSSSSGGSSDTSNGDDDYIDSDTARARKKKKKDHSTDSEWMSDTPSSTHSDTMSSDLDDFKNNHSEMNGDGSSTVADHNANNNAAAAEQEERANGEEQMEIEPEPEPEPDPQALLDSAVRSIMSDNTD